MQIWVKEAPAKKDCVFFSALLGAVAVTVECVTRNRRQLNIYLYMHTSLPTYTPTYLPTFFVLF